MKYIKSTELAERLGRRSNSVANMVRNSKSYLDAISELETGKIEGGFKPITYYKLNKDHILFLTGASYNPYKEEMFKIYQELEEGVVVQKSRGIGLSEVAIPKSLLNEEWEASTRYTPEGKLNGEVTIVNKKWWEFWK